MTIFALYARTQFFNEHLYVVSACVRASFADQQIGADIPDCARESVYIINKMLRGGEKIAPGHVRAPCVIVPRALLRCTDTRTH